MGKHTAIGIDLAKRVFQVCVVNTRHEQVQTNKELKRAQLLDFMRQQSPSRVFMEACGGAHYWARQFIALGHEVQLIAPQFVKPFRKGHKTDANDALAIVEAGRRPDTRYVPLKGLAQQDIQSLHRIRERRIKQRTQLLNQTHGLLQEYGLISGRGQKALREATALALEDAENELSPLMRELLAEQMMELRMVNEQITALDKRIGQLSRAVGSCRDLLAIEGVGPVVATQLYSVLGDGKAFRRGRQASAYLGLTPRQHSSGGDVRMTGIGRTGHGQVRAALIRGAHAVIKTLGQKDDPKSRWLRALIARVGVNKAAVALANKTVRTAWAVLRTSQAYCRQYEHSRSMVA